MAANNGGSDSTGKKFYYNISYGMLCANGKEAPEGYEKMSLSDIKARRTKNENVDLRNKYYDTENGKDYPLRIFYTDISGLIESVEKDKFDRGTSLKVTLHDADGDESVINTDFYGKICANFLNRLLNVNQANELNFRPYSIPTEWDINGEKIKGYNAGISIKDAGIKTEMAFKRENGLPDTEQVVNAKGESETSRVAQIEFLWARVQTKFAQAQSPGPAQAAQAAPQQANPQAAAPAPQAPVAKAAFQAPVAKPVDDLPF
tara:strand:+ start:8386 stop:9168 length:783 start_codon:yes stop_codon:yes gene_type:complete